MGGGRLEPPRTWLRTTDVASASGYSVQQVRDLERLGVIPPAERAANGYRQFSAQHLLALRAYRGIAAAVGPLAARTTLREARSLPLDDALGLISGLHVSLAKERADALSARRALLTIRDEPFSGAGEPDAAMTIRELAEALGVRPSTLRFWEDEGLVVPERVTSRTARRYPAAAVRDARITAALRAAGYGIPAVRRAVDAVRRLDVVDTLDALDARLGVIAQRTAALLMAGTDVARLLSGGAADATGGATGVGQPDRGRA